MNRKLIQSIALFITVLSTTANAQAIGSGEHYSGTREQFSEAMIVTKNCEAPLSKLMGEMIKYYIDRGDFESADALIQVAKKNQMAGISQPNKVQKPKQGKIRRDYEYYNRWIFGYF